ncbi:MAG: hypothetical protein AAFR04_10490 [Pseudomonadota bacterium]
MIDFRFSPEAMTLAVIQGVIAAAGLLILVWLTWRMVRKLKARAQQPASRREPKDWLRVAWPPVAWALTLTLGALLYSTVQPYSPRVMIPKTDLTITTPPGVDAKAPVQDLTPRKLTDAERLARQRALEAETRNRVNLK